MRTWTVPFLALLLGGCAAPAEPTAQVPLTWTGAFQGESAHPGNIHLLLDETGDTWKGTMYFESHDPSGELPRATYRIEGEVEDGVIHVVQKEILEADPVAGSSWCVGTYTLNLHASSAALSGSYAAHGGGCTGATSLQAVEEF